MIMMRRCFRVLVRRSQVQRTLADSLSVVTVLGGGVTGTTVVGALVDAGVSVTWIDEDFSQLGRMGKYYCDGVPANTTNGVLLRGLRSVKSFQFASYEMNRQHFGDSNTSLLSKLKEEDCSDLSYLVEPLMYASTKLRQNPLVTTIEGKLLDAQFDSKCTDEFAWTFCISRRKSCDESVVNDLVRVNSSIFFIACGAKPSWPANIPNNYPHQCVDSFVNSKAVKDILSAKPHLREEAWAVVGSSHSAMLVVKNLVEAGVERVFNYFRSDYIFEITTPEGWKKNRGSGLKGDVGKWVKETLPLCEHVERIRLRNEYELANAVHVFNDRVVYAVGYQRVCDFDITVDGETVCSDSLRLYCKESGEITSLLPRCSEDSKEYVPIRRGHCFGIGIGFPCQYTDEEGETEYWVGFHRNIVQLHNILSTLRLLNKI